MSKKATGVVRLRKQRILDAAPEDVVSVARAVIVDVLIARGYLAEEPKRSVKDAAEIFVLSNDHVRAATDPFVAQTVSLLRALMLSEDQEGATRAALIGDAIRLGVQLRGFLEGLKPSRDKSDALYSAARRFYFATLASGREPSSTEMLTELRRTNAILVARRTDPETWLPPQYNRWKRRWRLESALALL